MSADNQGMRAFPLLLAGLIAACSNSVGEGSAPAPGPDSPQPQPELPADPPSDSEEPADGPGQDPPVGEDPGETPPAEDPGEPDEVPGDDDGDGVVNASAPGPAPAEAGQSCSEWTECGPHYEDPNSGFDCVDQHCTCDDTGQWAQGCAELGGSWSSFECFCFTNTDTMMPTAAPETPEQAEEDVVCWWTWRLRYCDPDRWVDTSYYDHWCDAYDCYDDYVEDGYYEDGQCYGRWIKRCTDGNEYWY